MRFGCFMTIYQAIRVCNSLQSNSVTRNVYQILENFVCRMVFSGAHFATTYSRIAKVCHSVTLQFYKKIMLAFHCKGKGKAIPLQTWTVP